MVDPKQALAEAKKKLKQLAASSLVRKERLEEELARLRADRSKIVAQLEQAIDLDQDESALALTQLKSELEASIAQKEGDVALAEQQIEEAMSEIKGLADTAEDLERATNRAVIDAAVNPDPFSTSPVDRALDNVRDHIANLEAQVELSSELSGERIERESARIDRDLAEAKARSQLEAMKAARKGKSGRPDTSSSTGDEGPGSDDPTPPKSKKTM